jgi:hypothetical protein
MKQGYEVRRQSWQGIHYRNRPQSMYIYQDALWLVYPHIHDPGTKIPNLVYDLQAEFVLADDWEVMGKLPN